MKQKLALLLFLQYSAPVQTLSLFTRAWWGSKAYTVEGGEKNMNTHNKKKQGMLFIWQQHQRNVKGSHWDQIEYQAFLIGSKKNR